MSFTSVPFLILVAAGLLLYRLVPQKLRWCVLLAVSCVFYLSGGLSRLWYLLFTGLSTYGAGLLLGRLNARRKSLPPEQKKTGGAKIKNQKRLVVLAAVLLNFGLLYGVKYWDFTAGAINQAAGTALPQLNLVLPLGLSFYMFQSVGYVIDCFRDKYPPQRNILKYLLFVSFFPQMVQGPISRYDQLAPQLTAGKTITADDLKYGIQLAMWGYLKKLVVADRASVVVSAVFSTPEEYGGAAIAFGVLFYCIQLYFDFSGGIDITRGVAEMFGIHVVENFRRPIFATSLTDYWRRWHITLGAWMRDYVFYPMSLSKPLGKLGKLTRRKIGGKLGKIIPTSIATFTVYFIIGIWHGANFRYVFFGFWNGALITGAFLLDGVFVKMKNRLGITGKEGWYHGFQMLRTMVLVFIGRYVSRAPRLLTAFSMLWTTVSRPQLSQLRDGILLKLGLGGRELAVVAVGVLVLLAVEGAQEKGVAIRKAMERQNLLIQWLGILVPLLVLLVFGILRDSTISAEFIYKQF